MAGLYSYYLAPLVLNRSMVNIPQMLNTGNRLGGWIVVYNNSPYKIQVQLPGSGNVLPLDPQTVDKLQVNSGDMVIYILPLTLLPGGSPSTQVDVQVYPGEENEPPGQYPMSLSRQTSPVAGTARFGYSQTMSVSATTGNNQIMNVFNPLTSGVDYVFYSIIAVLTGGTATSSVVVDLEGGPDLNLGTSQGIAQPHDLSSPASNAHLTSANQAAFPGNTPRSQPLSNQVVPGTVGQELLLNGDLLVSHQGQNCFTAFAATTGQTAATSMFWYEQ